jgi:hypothetical protein
LLFDVFALAIAIIFFIIWIKAFKGAIATYKSERSKEIASTEITTVEIVETDIKDVLTEYDYSKLYSYKEQGYSDTCLTITVDEAALLMKVARSEGGDTKEGQLWIMGVILNRLNDERFPNTIEEVISQKGQFEVYRTGVYKEADVNTNSHLALADLESGINPTQGAVWFEANTNSDHSWHKKKEFIAEVEGNRFYK